MPLPWLALIRSSNPYLRAAGPPGRADTLARPAGPCQGLTRLREPGMIDVTLRGTSLSGCSPGGAVDRSGSAWYALWALTRGGCSAKRERRTLTTEEWKEALSLAERETPARERWWTVA